MHHLRIKSITVLFVAGYLLFGVSALATGFCPKETEPCRAGRFLSLGCCLESENPQTRAHPWGACVGHCELGKHSGHHLISSPVVKRLKQNQQATATLPVPTGYLAAGHFYPPVQLQSRLLNPILAVLATVVLLN